MDRYSSVAVNNRGAGASDAPADESDFTVQAFAADAFELAAKLGWSDFTLVGHSLLEDGNDNTLEISGRRIERALRHQLRTDAEK